MAFIFQIIVFFGPLRALFFLTYWGNVLPPYSEGLNSFRWILKRLGWRKYFGFIGSVLGIPFDPFASSSTFTRSVTRKEPVRVSETSEQTKHTTQCKKPEDSNK